MAPAPASWRPLRPEDEWGRPAQMAVPPRDSGWDPTLADPSPGRAWEPKRRVQGGPSGVRRHPRSVTTTSSHPLGADPHARGVYVPNSQRKN